ncbi:hypothetical protein BJ878DRAFT_263346 [Calycina marina]|uniref:Uncharacterized protein n=1 Tax=Calycina marina TaxID=1763456 RepID=A0A9P7Z7J3_9HELO|nr:hypothetical protein BJ878DRAFT_263346 [Calycina marina]
MHCYALLCSFDVLYRVQASGVGLVLFYQVTRQRSSEMLKPYMCGMLSYSACPTSTVVKSPWGLSFRVSWQYYSLSLTQWLLKIVLCKHPPRLRQRHICRWPLNHYPKLEGDDRRDINALNKSQSVASHPITPHSQLPQNQRCTGADSATIPTTSSHSPHPFLVCCVDAAKSDI